MSDDDLIRRGDALKIALGLATAESAEKAHHAIAALPAVTVGEEAFMTAVWGALKADATDLGKQQRILAAFRSALEPVAAPDPALRPTMTDMMVDPDMLDAFMEANPLPPDPAAIREAALREAAAVAESWHRQWSMYSNGNEPTRDDRAGGITYGRQQGAETIAAAILALISKGAADDRA